jgi:hydrogenase/urease accessory protein HupE
VKPYRLLALLGLAVAMPAWPHAGSNAFLFVVRQGDRVDTRVDLAVRDLDELLALDADGDGRVTWQEVESLAPAIRGYAADHLHLRTEAADCERSDPPAPLQAVEHADGWYAVVHLAVRCDPAVPVTLEWSGVFDIDASHRAQVRWQHGRIVDSTVLSPRHRTMTLEAGAHHASGVETFGRYLREGVVHVLTGLDHLLFLAGLFLPVALERTREGWRPVPSRRVAFTRAAVIVTAFTAAHAVSLCLVALGTFQPPTRLVESLVAFSVAFAGFNNLVPLVAHRRLAWLAAAFGLVHGAAIGSALLDLGLPVGARTLALAAFNLGVECAQLLPVSLAVLVTFAFREKPLYRRAVLLPGSALVTLAGVVWLTWRALALPSVFG